MDDLCVNKVWRNGPKQKNIQTKSKQNNFNPNFKQSKERGPFCSGCYYLGQQLQARIHIRHHPSDCPRKSVTVNMLRMEDEEHFECTGNINTPILAVSSNKNNFQETRRMTPNMNDSTSGEKLKPRITSIDCLGTDDSLHSDHIIPIIEDVEQFNISDKIINSSSHSSITSTPTSLMSAVYKLETKWAKDRIIRKEKSPTVSVIIHSRPAVATIDEGSEINCLDEGFALRSKILFIPTSCKATAAGKSRMKLVSQTREDLKLHLADSTMPLTWNLGKAVVVSNLGVDVLVGEPGKADNKITTIPHKKKIKIVSDNAKEIILPYKCRISQKNNSYSTCRAIRSYTCFPGDKVNQMLDPHMHHHSHVCISPRKDNSNPWPWFQPKILKVQFDGSINIINESNNIVYVKKNEHYADVRPCEVFINNIDQEAKT